MTRISIVVPNAEIHHALQESVALKHDIAIEISKNSNNKEIKIITTNKELKLKLPVAIKTILEKLFREFAPSKIIFANWELDVNERRITLNDKQSRSLTEKETQILLKLIDNKNKLVTREALLEEVWGYNLDFTTHTLETYIYRLRQKLDINEQETSLLETLPGGYRLNDKN